MATPGKLSANTHKCENACNSSDIFVLFLWAAIRRGNEGDMSPPIFGQGENIRVVPQ